MLAIPALAAIAIYLPALPGGFLSDDYSLLHTFYGADAREVAARVGKTFVSGVGPPSNQYRPLTMASFALNAHASGADAAAWRLVNVLLHAANAALVALLAWQLAGAAARGARVGGARGGTGVRVVRAERRGRRLDCRPLRRDVAVLDARRRLHVPGERRWRDRYGLASLGATVLAFMSKESAAIAPALILALAWVKRPDGRGPVARGRARAVARAALARDRGRVFRVPRVDLRRPVPVLSRHLAGAGAAVRKVACGVAREPRLVAAGAAGNGSAHGLRLAGLLLGVAAVSAGLRHRRERRVLVALVLTFLAALAMLFSHTGWSVTGEGGRVLYAIAAIAALALALPLRTPDRRLRMRGVDRRRRAAGERLAADAAPSSGGRKRAPRCAR